MKLSIVALLTGLAVSVTGFTVSVQAQDAQTGSYHSEDQAASLDALLAPVALYPDTVLTHILIAATYPLDVVAADRWRQANSHLSDESVARHIENFDWDPSVKALVLFSDVLQTMAEDLSWLDALGQQVLASQSQVLSRVQVLRQQAMSAGNLQTNQFITVGHTQSSIVIHPVSPHTVYLPYYDTRVVYGSRWHRHQPVYWQWPAHYHRRAGIYWSPAIHFSAVFDFGAIHWSKRYVIVNRESPRHYRYHSPVKRVKVKDYQRWQPQHRKIRRHAGYQRPRSVSGHSYKPERLVTRNIKQAKDTYTVSKQPAVVSRSHGPAYAENRQKQKVNSYTREHRPQVRNTHKVRQQNGSQRHRDGRTINRQNGH